MLRASPQAEPAGLGRRAAALATTATRPPATETATTLRRASTLTFRLRIAATFARRLRRTWRTWLARRTRLARSLRLLLLLRLLRRRAGFATSGAASAATTPASIATARLLFARGLLRLLRGDCCFIARRTFASLLLTAALLATFTRLLLASARLLLPTFGPRRTRTASAALFFRRAAAGALFELLHFPLHELTALRIQFYAQRVVTAVRAALPSVRMRFLAGGAYDAFGQRHRNRRALYTSRL